MKILCFFLTLIIGMLGMTQTGFAQNAEPDDHTLDRRINVTGEAELRVVPDQVIFSMSAQTRGKTVMESAQKNEKPSLISLRT